MSPEQQTQATMSANMRELDSILKKAREVKAAPRIVPIKDAVGHLIACPAETGDGKTCGQPAPVVHSAGRVSKTGPSQTSITASGWYRVECPKSGKKLYRYTTMVEVIG